MYSTENMMQYLLYMYKEKIKLQTLEMPKIVLIYGNQLLATNKSWFYGQLNV